MKAVRRLLVRLGLMHNKDARWHDDCPKCMLNTWNRNQGWMAAHRRKP